MATVEEFLAQDNAPFLLRQNAEESRATPTDTASRVYRLQELTGLPEDAITQNLEEVEQAATKTDFDAETFRKQSPRVAQWLEKSPNAYATIKDEVDVFGKFEHAWTSAKAGWEAAEIQSELADVVGAYMSSGKQSVEETARMSKLRGDLMYAQRVQKDSGSTLDYVAGTMANTVKQGISPIPDVIKGALTGAIAGGIAGAPVVGVGAIPGAGAGAVAGMTVAGYNYTKRLEQAMAFLELGETLDIDGNSLPFATRVSAAETIGAVNGLIEVGGSAAIVGLIPGVKQLVRKILPVDEARKLVVDQVKKRATSRPVMAAKAVGAVVAIGATEGAEEFAQAYAGAGVREITKSASDQQFESVGFTDEDFDSALSQAQDAFVGSALTFGLLGGGGKFYSQIRDARKAQDVAKVYDNINSTASESRADPAVKGAVIQSIVEGGPQETVHIDAQTWYEYWESKGIAPDVVAAQIYSDISEYTLAVASGGSLVIPVGKYVEYIAGTEHATFFADNLRPTPEAINRVEALALEKDIEAQVQAAQADPVQAVTDNLTEQLQATGYGYSEASALAEQASAVFENLGGGLGVSPERLKEFYGLSVTGESAPVASVEAPVDIEATDDAPTPPPSQASVANERADSPRWLAMQKDILLEQPSKRNIGAIPIVSAEAIGFKPLDLAGSVETTTDVVENLKRRLAALEKEKSENLRFEQSAKGKRVGATGTAEQWIQRNEKLVDWNTVLPKGKAGLEELRAFASGALDLAYDDQTLYAAAQVDVTTYMERSAAQNNPHLPAEVQEALSDYRDNPAASVAILNSVATQQRLENLRAWRQYLTEDNPIYSEDVFFAHFVWDGFTSALPQGRPGAGIPLDRAALALVYDTISNNPGNTAFSTLYQRAVTRLVEESLDKKQVIDSTQGRRWIQIPKTAKKSKDFEQNTTQLRALSCSSWCTSQGLEKTYLPLGDFYILQDRGVTRVAIRMAGDEVAEIQGQANDGSIPLAYFEDVDVLLADNTLKISERTKNKLAEAKAKILFKKELEALDNAELAGMAKATLLDDGTYELADAIDNEILSDVVFSRLKISRVEFRETARLSSAEHLVYVKGDLVLLDNASLPALTTVEGTVLMYAGASAPLLTTVGGKLEMFEGASAPTLTTVGGNLVLLNNASLPALTTVGGDLTLEKGASAPLLTTVEGTVLMYAGASASALTTVGGNLVMFEGASAPSLTTVGGALVTYKGASAPTLTTVGSSLHMGPGTFTPVLTTVGGDLIMFEGASTPTLTTVGGDLIMFEGASAPTLTTVGGNLVMREGASAPSLTTVQNRPYDPESQTFNQDPVEPRGEITITPERKATITLNKGKDLSTFLHESSHLYLEMLRDVTDDTRWVVMATQLGVDPTQANPQREQMKLDAATAAAFVGAEDLNSLTVEQHELFARAGEAYFREGNAPSPELAPIFARFSEWLKRIYRDVAQLDVTLTDDVRRVFDRLLAADVQLAKAVEESATVGKFATAAAAGLSQAEFEAYEKLGQSAIDSAKARLAKHVAKGILNAQTTARREAKAALTQQVNERILATRDYAAVEALRARPLSLEVLKDYYPPTDDVNNPTGQLVRNLVRMRVAINNSITDPDDVAIELGYGSGDEMVRALATLQPRAVAVKQEVDAQLAEQFGDKLDNKALHTLAVEQLNGPERSQVLELELSIVQALHRKVKPVLTTAAAQVSSVQVAGLKVAREARTRQETKEMRKLVEVRIAALPIKQLHPGSFLAAARRASVKATESAGRQDWLATITQIRLELYNTELHRAALRTLREVETTRKYALRLQETPMQERLGLAGGVANADGTVTPDNGYQEQVNALLERFEFRRQTDKLAQRNKTLVTWVEERRAEGLPINLPAGMLDEAYKKPYKDMTPTELGELKDTLKHLVHLATLKNKLATLVGTRDFNEVVEELVASADTAKRRKTQSIETRLPQDAAMKNVRDWLAEQRKPSSLAKELDGFKDGGIWWRTIIQPLNAAAAEESRLQVETHHKLSELFKPLFGLRERLATSVSRLPFAPARGLFRQEHIPEINRSLSRVGRLVVALNWGNGGNRQSLMTGYGWTEEQVTAILKPLTKKEWDFVQGVWDLMESQWPATAALMRRVDGVAPTKVEAVAVETPFGIYRGGYFRLKYDGRQSPRARAFLVADAVKAAMGGGGARSQTAHGHTEARMEGVNMPVRLDLGVIFEAFNEGIHHLTHYEALIDANRVLSSKRVQKALIDGYGIEVQAQFQHALDDVAAGSVPVDTATERAFSYVRQGASIAGLGWSVTTAAMQVIGVTQSIKFIGAKWMAVGLRDFIGDATKMEGLATQVHKESSMMASRSTTMTREVYDLAREVTAPGLLPVGVSNSFFWLMTKMQTLVDVPTYLGARAKALHELGHDKATSLEAQQRIYAQAVAQAEQAVLDSQGGGNLIDRSALYRKAGAIQLFTLFGTYFNTLYNASAESVRKYRLAPLSPTAIGHLISDFILLYLGPAVLTVLFKEAFSSDEDTEDREEKVLKEMASMGVSNLVGVRELSGLFSEYPGYGGPAGIRVVGATTKALQEAQDVVVEGDPVDIRTFKTINAVGGVLFHYPATQLNRVVAGLAHDIEEGELSRAPLVGPPR